MLFFVFPMEWWGCNYLISLAFQLSNEIQSERELGVTQITLLSFQEVVGKKSEETAQWVKEKVEEKEETKVGVNTNLLRKRGKKEIYWERKIDIWIYWRNSESKEKRKNVNRMKGNTNDTEEETHKVLQG